VLVVDDDAVNRLLLSRLLARMGVNQLRVEGQADRLGDIVRDFQPDLILMDLHVGDVDGLDALREVAAQDPDWSARRVIMITGETGDQIERRCRDAGVSSVLTKPYTAELLLSTVEEALASLPGHERRAPPTAG